MNKTLWAAQVFLALTFSFHGFIKLAVPATLPPPLAWIHDLSAGMLVFIGISELLGAAGVLLPALTRILPRLTVWAAAGLATVMVLAAGWHIMRSEPGLAILNLGLGGVAAFVAYGRAQLVPIESR